jgi:hypothetical protein
MARPNKSTPSEYAQGARPTRANVPFLGVAADSKRQTFDRIDFDTDPGLAPKARRNTLRFVKRLLNMADRVNDKRLRGG